MAISPEIDREIENDAKELKADEFLRPQTGISEFQEDFTNLLGRVTEDKEHFEAAGYDVNKMDKNYCLLEKLSLGRGKRISTEVIPGENDQKYTTGMEEARKNRKILAAAAKFISNNTTSVEIKKACNAMKTGNTDIEVLTYNIAAVNFARNHMDLVSKIRPGKVTIDDTFLQNVELQALELTKLKGTTTVSEDKPDQSVDYQNRIITLCVKEYREIKQYAELAFLFEPDHYSKYYSDYQAPKNDSNNIEATKVEPEESNSDNASEINEMETASA
jgi:hypothetical protein